ncbi:MAG: cupin domain-containing protein [Chloroflexota bacterium]
MKVNDEPAKRRRKAPRQRFAGSEHLFDLAAEGARLDMEPGGGRDGHRQITLFRGGGVSILLFDFEAGGWLKDHAADGYVTVHVLSGEIQMATAEQTYRMPARSLLVLRPGIRHDVRADTASRMLLTVRLDPSEDARP